MTARVKIGDTWYEQGTNEYYSALGDEFAPRYDSTPEYPTERILARQFWNYPNREALPVAVILAGLKM